MTDLSKLKYGRYTLRAKLLIDSNANEKFNDKDIDSFVYISKEVEYKARPMVKNDYFLMLFGDKYKLEVDEESQTVTVILIASLRENKEQNYERRNRLLKEKLSICDKAYLTLEEAAEYFNIGINKLREMTNDKNCPYVIWNGTKRLIKRKKLEAYLDGVFTI